MSIGKQAGLMTMLLLGAGGILAAEPQGRFHVLDRVASGELEVRLAEKPILVYAFAKDQFKPYVRELYTLQGDNLLRDAPADHLHHHGLMYAVHVNGVNFWEEIETSGRQEGVSRPVFKTRVNAAGLPEAVISHRIHWVRPGGQSPPLLIEDRTLTLTVDDSRGEVALEWHANFEVGNENVTIGGSSYNGLGVRFPASFDRAARFQNSESTPYPAGPAHRLTDATWSSASGPVDGRQAHLALGGGTANAGIQRFFSMVEPFAYLSATQNIEQAPLQYSARETFTLNYLILVYGEPPSHEALNGRFERWSGSLP